MPTAQWSYPYNAADTHTCHFYSSPANASYLWDAPHHDTPLIRHTRIETEDGSQFVYDMGSDSRIIVCRFATIPSGSAAAGATNLRGYDGLLYFLQNGPDFGKNTFGFFDELGGGEIPVRYMGGIDTFRILIGRYRTGEIILRKEV
jgi:hypothetical protein